MTQRVTISSPGHADVQGELALPPPGLRAPALVLVHEWWGVNDHVRAVAGRLSREGFIVYAPDLFHGKTTKDPNEAGALLAALDWKRALAEIASSVAFLGDHVYSNGKVGVLGFGLGAGLTFAAAALAEVSAAVPFYGLPKPEFARKEAMRAPIQAHFAARDQWAKPSIARELQAELEAAGRSMELHVYDADHAFLNDTRPEVYNAQAAETAWQRAVAFLKKQLG
ncbi:MAG TPA: dienelactone hydrolase family protein [Polyangiaceae bacterium]|nr:dienelactone hydrolase family protein [Polyangiaceae bacterium]